jgi:hypothetical protein
MVSILQNDSSGTPLQGYAVMAQPGMAGATELTGQNAITPVITVSGGESFVVSLRQHSGTTLSCDPAINRSWFSIEVIEPVTVTGIGTGGGGGASTLQEAYDGGDGTISTTGGKPFELTGTGELTAETVGAATSITVSGQPVATGTSTNFGPNYLGTFEQVNSASSFSVDLPAGFIRFEFHMQNVQFESGDAGQSFELRTKSVATPSFGSVDVESTAHATRSTSSTSGGANVTAQGRSNYQTSTRFFINPNTGSYNPGQDVDQRLNGILEIIQVGDADNFPAAYYRASYITDNDRFAHVEGGMVRYEKSRLTGVSFQFNAGGAWSGKITLYGWQEPTY